VSVVSARAVPVAEDASTGAVEEAPAPPLARVAGVVSGARSLPGLEVRADGVVHADGAPATAVRHGLQVVRAGG